MESGKAFSDLTCLSVEDIRNLSELSLVTVEHGPA
jgi:hypothetical protein